ncbi:udp-galactose transporter like protein [Diplodia corticola]|uniref:Udp-galactose transporter like protein n=1 Tax=Diplodia corticola TaxID=236234 RepID=A0A1J9S9M5_9PEZI|nr:udp-galactose transporter like protein [Diplodia corticola]OJD36596.1 udp-galactose transporter like protein [Diplodia corticola]
MSAQSRDQLDDLESHRLRLEEQIARLRKSLQHWQTWDAEYEGLKEEIQGFKKTPDGPDPTAADMVLLGRKFGGQLVDEKEITELLGKDLNRSANQVIDLISRRQEYVQKNVDTVQKQVDAAEDKLNKVIIISEPSLADEEGGPLMDIREELDEEGNVLSSSISQPGHQTAQIMDTLKKAGIELPEEGGEGSSKAEGISDAAEPTTASDQSGSEGKKQDKGKAPVRAESSSPAAPPPRRKKSVAFAPDTKAPAGSSGVPEASGSISAHMNFKPGSRVVELNDKDEVVGAEVAGPQNPGIQKPVIPENESEEDAQMRREMLEYHLNEVGHVVAELNLDEGGSDDDEYDYEEEDSDIEEVEEDEWGRSRPVITEEYLQKMRDLEKKLDAQMIENLGPAPEEADLNNMLQQAQGVHKLVVRTDEQIPPALLPKTSTKTKQSTKPQDNDKAAEPTAVETAATSNCTSPSSSKGVRFADSVDVSPAPKPASEPLPPISTEPRPIADAIIERSTAVSSDTTPSTPVRKASRFKAVRAALPQTPIASSFPTTTLPNQEQTPSEPSATDPAPSTPTRKPSRFKTARAALPQTPLASSFPKDDDEEEEEEKEEEEQENSRPHHRPTPTRPPNATLAPTVIERASASSSSPTPVSAPDPDGLDPATLSQEALTAYHKLRAKMIQRQDGGFVRPSQEEEEEAAGAGPLVEEREDGSVRRVSRFRAARVRAAEQQQ